MKSPANCVLTSAASNARQDARKPLADRSAWRPNGETKGLSVVGSWKPDLARMDTVMTIALSLVRMFFDTTQVRLRRANHALDTGHGVCLCCSENMEDVT